MDFIVLLFLFYFFRFSFMWVCIVSNLNVTWSSVRANSSYLRRVGVYDGLCPYSWICVGYLRFCESKRIRKEDCLMLIGFFKGKFLSEERNRYLWR
jgi:hypothetical protein